MGLIERYLLRQLASGALAALIVLVVLAFVSRSYSALRVLVDQHQDVGIYLQVLVLAMPLMVSMSLPVVLLAAFLVVLTRVDNDGELVVSRAAGIHPSRLLAPGVLVALGVTGLCLTINLWLEPYCYRRLNEVAVRIQDDIAAQFLHPGEFTRAPGGITIFARGMQPDGRLSEVFLNQRHPRGEVTVVARSARVVRGEGQILLQFEHGSTQIVDARRTVSEVTFDRYDLPVPFPDRGPPQLRLTDRYLPELFWPAHIGTWERANRRAMLSEGHARLASPLYNLAFAMMAMAAVLGRGGRHGHTRLLIGVGLSALVCRVLGFAAQSVSLADPVLNGLQYLAPAAGIILSAIWLSPWRPFPDWLARPRPAPAAEIPALASSPAPH